MAVFYSWIQSNWFSVAQALGILAGLWFTAASFQQQAKAKEAENILTLNEQHRELWSGARERPELKRVFQIEADLTQPASIDEEEFLNLVIVHYETGWQMAKTGTVLSPEILAVDVRAFFSLPLPRAVWEKTKQFRNPRFVRFVTKAIQSRALEAAGHLRQPGT